MRVVRIEPSSDHLATVKKLHRANSKTLGFFPFGAFDEYAARGQTLVAEDHSGQCLGYLLYRISKMSARIVHLCVQHEKRRKGVARHLVDYLIANTKQYRGIGLLCRRDYEASKVWPQLGFVALHDKPGRSYSGELLTLWWLDHGQPSIFDFKREQLFDTGIPIVIDACVMFDMHGPVDADSEESCALSADWLKDQISLCITSETLNEINRQDDHELRKKQRLYARKFKEIKAKPGERKALEDQITLLFPPELDESDKSDIRQLAHTVSEQLPFFATRDGHLLAMKRSLMKRFGVSVISPGELIAHLDRLARSAEYQPARLAGSTVTVSLARSEEASELIDIFCSYERAERKGQFRNSVRRYMASPQTYEFHVIRNEKQKALVMYVLDRSSGERLTVPIFRLSRTTLSPTAARYALANITRTANKEKRSLTQITDQFMIPEAVSAVLDAAFTYLKNRWIRFAVRLQKKATETAKTLDTMCDDFKEEHDYLQYLANVTRDARAEANVEVLAAVERLLFPVKIADAPLMNYIIPIKPIWAMHLFDERLAEGDLFGAQPHTMLNSENVYYRARRPGNLVAPARILWYVTSDSKYPGSKHVRACSRLDEVVVAKPEKLHDRFNRLGVYKRKQVFQIRSSSRDPKIMALRFSDTELFDSPVSWAKLQKILQRDKGCRSPLRSPVPISPSCFLHIYQRGIGKKKGG